MAVEKAQRDATPWRETNDPSQSLAFNFDGLVAQ
jgi:hypothetical protein